ncbi:phosphatidylglycerol:prolipoprotein diacylglycerol transferase [Chryseomicrobium aureum]|uniref:prolipoprotein diacylglyceryl transferase n=1 Tax=Chryseomicrobium aureum TaxID=1441723 RepID=UPI001959E158|nr:prolipoprotein diacylglyceryl transferase [Chryseomicrobium aureum]MBM7707236.1 phosphatidylglycerol:prolipoprotein diacylglycerol transferase [Chryseomicrobium aureum]
MWDSVLLAIDPVAFQLGPLSIRWYGVIIALGIVVAFLVAQKEMVKRGFHQEYLTDLLLWAIPLAIIGARIYYVIFKWENYADNPLDAFKIWEGGIAIHGALIASFLTAYFFTRKRKDSFLKVTDIVAPSILIGQTVGRWGNFINQEAHGGEVTRSFLESLYIPNWIIEQMNIRGTYYHPTFLYESIWNLTGVVILIVLRKVNLLRGEMFLFYLTWYSVGRFFIEGLRTDSLYLVGDLRTAQVVSLVTIVVAIIVFVYRRFVLKVKVRYQD